MKDKYSFNISRCLLSFVLLTLLFFQLHSSLATYSNVTQSSNSEWRTFLMVGEFLNSNPAKPDETFIVHYRVINGTEENTTQEGKGGFTATVSSSNNLGVLEIKIPRNYPYTNQPGLVGAAKTAIILFDGTQIPYNAVTQDDCFFDYLITFSGHKKIELTYTYLTSRFPSHGDEVPEYCIKDTVFQNSTNNENVSVPEFPFAIPVFLVSITSLIIFYRMKFR